MKSPAWILAEPKADWECYFVDRAGPRRRLISRLGEVFTRGRLEVRGSDGHKRFIAARMAGTEAGDKIVFARLVKHIRRGLIGRNDLDQIVPYQEDIAARGGAGNRLVATAFEKLHPGSIGHAE